ncbi:hypothetical protein [Ruminococcus albus]|uniref:Uncharacterized protein n=1 Tax=Ruminococcus albus TaxID=1264 RepID=A0A1I1QSZ4_RUMAL|nr:hypothetical protein [Ruminococcus albus]SFD25145.1 hypothetical protein SAMN02910406_03503 [Ruminococcus albus]
MNKVASGIKLYTQAAAHPFTIGFGLFMMIGMTLAFIIDPAPVGSKDYLSMLGSIQMGNMGTLIMVIIASTKLQQNKFYSSCNCAKELFTVGPLAVVTAVNILYNTVLAVSAYVNLGVTGLSDTIIFNTISSMLIIIAGGCYGKNSVKFIAVIQLFAYIAFIIFPIAVKHTSFTHILLGQHLTTAVIFAVCGNIIAIAFILALQNIWWKKGDKFAAPKKALLAALEVQANE